MFPNAGTLPEVQHQLQQPGARAAAAYVESMRMLDCTIEGPMVEHLQKDMAARRQADRSIDGHHFHIWLSVRLDLTKPPPPPLSISTGISPCFLCHAGIPP